MKNRYICLSKKDKLELLDWNKKMDNDSLVPKKIKNKKTKRKKRKDTDKLSLMADELKGKSYIDFLQSDYWSIVRLMVLKRDGRKCVICGSTKNLQVHHDSYKGHFREHKNLERLMTLCKNCHTEHHYAQK